MAHIITAVFAVAMIMSASMLVTASSLSSASRVSLAWERMAQISSDKERTGLTLIQADILATSSNVDISVRNSGQTALRDFAVWDVIIQYYATTANQGMNISRLTYTSSTPTAGEWTVSGVFINVASSTAEVYEPDVFNSGEEAVIRLNLTSSIPVNTDNLVTIGTPNGVTVPAQFSR